MPSKSPKAELAEIRDQQRRLRQRERALLACLNDDRFDENPVAVRPGWPMQRITEHRAT